MKQKPYSRLAAIGITLLIFIVWAGVSSNRISLAAGPTPRKAPAAKFAPGEVLVKLRLGVDVYPGDLRTSAPPLNRLLKDFHLSEMRPVFSEVRASPRETYRLPNGQERKLPDLARIYRMRFPAKADIFQVIAALEKNPLVEYAEPNYVRHIVDTATTVTPNDPYYNSSGSWGQGFADMWGLHIIQAGDAWGISTGSSSIIVAVADTGVDLTHPDLAGKLVAGYDFANGDSDPQDDNGHGTHVAGTIAATTNNGIGVAGICWQCKIMPLKGLDADGSGYDSDLADAVRYAADHGARVLNASWGGPGYSQTLDSAFTYAHGRGVVLAVAAGNDGTTDVGSPASFPVSIAVSATDHNDQIASFSNYGSAIAVAAPGVDILSLRAAGTDMYGDGWHIVGNQYYRSNGTSMAAPHVAGLAGLILSLHPSWTPDQVRSALTSSADDLGSPGRDDYYGYGRINAYRALQGTTPPPGTTPTVTPTATPTATPSSCLAESDHPYASNFDYTWTLTNPDVGATGTRVQFTRLETEQGYDYVILRDGSGVEFQRFDGTVPDHTWSAPIPGQVVKIELVTDYSVTAWGFCVEALASSAITPTPTPTTGAAGDAYEPDNSAVAANPIATNGTVQHHTFHVADDEDWMSFVATAGQTYHLATSNLGPNADTVMDLYDTDGLNWLDWNDDCVGLASCLDWSAPADGTYFARVGPYSSDRTGTGSEYDFSIVASGMATVTPTPTATQAPVGICRTYDSTDTPLAIPDNDPAGVVSWISVPDSFVVVDANLTLTVTHTWDGDLRAYLDSPRGTRVILFENVGGSGNDFVHTMLDDGATQQIAAGTAPFTGSFQPQTPLSTVNGEPARRDWVLGLVDDYGNDFGSLVSWQLELCAEATTTATPSATPSATPTSTFTPTASPTGTPSPTPTATFTATPTASATPTATFTATPTATPTQPACPADLTGDGQVDEQDVALAVAAWHTHAGDPGYDARIDLNGDGVITVDEVQWVAAQMGCGS